MSFLDLTDSSSLISPKMPSTLLDLRSQLLFYKKYHHEQVNVAIHSVFVPTILFSSASMLHRVVLYKDYTLTSLLTTCYASFYLLLNLPVGLLATGLLILMNVAIDSHWVPLTFNQELILFTIGWVCQFIGHGVFEKRRPALLDNLVQSLVLAPYFILFELLFRLGFMPGLKQQLEADVRDS
mgnify:CR=1 FL=1